MEKMAGTRLAATVVLLLLLCWSTHQADAQVTVEITVSRTDPPGFVPGGPFEFRAASGPQVFTCTATGGAGSGDYDYVWTSTCSRGCAFQRTSTGATSVITRGAFQSGDIGTHTCTATRGVESGSDSITLNVVGYGIHIFQGTSTPSSTVAAGSLPNNGLVIATITGDDEGRFLRIFCRSDSLMANVGDIIGRDGTVISSGRFVIERPQPGEITMINSATEGPLPSNEQGVYTCRIPDSTDTMRNINIGIYIAGFNTVSTIANPLVFTQGSSSSTLTCTSIGSVATTVTFMRDSTTTVGPLREGESMDFGGVTYQLAQTVSNRAESTYQNVLTINQPLASIVGSSFTCSVQNTVGTSTPSDSLQIMAACVPNPCQNGGTCISNGSGSFTCDCIAGYTGGLCDVNINDCEPDPCLNGGTCNDEVGGFMCDCISGFTGETCDVNINDCEPDPCLNGGTCNDEVDGFMCDCISGFTGETCDTEVDDGSQDLFQIQFGPVEHCVSWNSEKATSLENAIHSAIISVLGDHCQCMFPSSNIDSGHFTCLTTPMQATYRSTIFGIVGNNATHLLSVLQDWVATGPVIELDWMLLHVSPDCPIHIASMADPECSPSEPLTFDNPTLITSDSVVIQCVNVCLLRMRGRSICGV